MSYRIQDLIWQKALEGRSAAERFVLMSLAFRANEAGVCWPSLDGIARITNLNVKTVRASINALAECGLISKAARPGAPTLYTINVAAVSALPDVSWSTKNGTTTKTGTPTESGTSTEFGTSSKIGTHTEIGITPLPKMAGEPIPNLVPEQVIQQAIEQTTLNTSPSPSSDFCLEAPELPKAKRAPSRKAPRVLEKPLDCSQEIFDEWVAFKDTFRSKCSQRMVDFLVREAEKAGISSQEAMLTVMEHGWQNFDASYMKSKQTMRSTAMPAIEEPVIDYHRGINPDGTF